MVNLYFIKINLLRAIIGLVEILLNLSYRLEASGDEMHQKNLRHAQIILIDNLFLFKNAFYSCFS